MNRSAALISSLFLALATPAWSCTIFVVARNGMVIAGEDWSGYSISSAGDVNGDDLDDLLIGAALAGPTGSSRAGETYLVYGRSGGATLSGAFDLADADVTFNGIAADDRSSWSVSSAGDVNGDGLDDVLIGAHWADPNGDSKAGETYLVYGRDGGATLSGAFDLADADVTFNGIDVDGLSGSSFCSLAYGYRPRNSAA